MNVAKLREEISATRHLTYLNTGWSGPSPRVVMDRIKECLEYENCGGPTSPPVLERHRKRIEEARQAIASLLGAIPDEITLTENTTEGINIILNGLDWQLGDEVITCDLEHSSVLVPCYYLSRRRGVALKIVRLAGSQSKETILKHLEEAMSSRTKLLCLSHIMYCNGLLLPLAEVQALARRHGAMVLVDGAQAVGQISVDVKEMGCEFYALPGHKWLLGPEGTGALYIRQDLISKIEPSKVAHKGAISYDLKGNFTPNTDSITKFELTTSSTALIAGLVAAVSFLEAVGFEQIHSRVRLLSDLMREKLLNIPGITIHGPSKAGSASGLISFSLRGRKAEDVTSYLWQKERIVARSLSRPCSTRLSLDFFNTEEEIERTAEGITSLADS